MLAFSYLSKSHNNIYHLPILRVVGPEFLCRRVGTITILLRVGSRMRLIFLEGKFVKQAHTIFLVCVSKFIKLKSVQKLYQRILFKIRLTFLVFKLFVDIADCCPSLCSGLYSHPLYLRQCVAHPLLPNFFIFTSLINKISCFYFNILCGVFSIFLD